MSKLYVCHWRGFLSSGDGYEIVGLTKGAFDVIFVLDYWDKDE